MSVGGPELELLADGAASELARAGRHAAPPGSPCHNCGTIIRGPFCHACGQKADDFHRSVWHLATEAIEGLTHFDGRIWTSMVRLVRRPGTLTREYIEGRRASQLPPFRMFLVMVVVVFFVGSLTAPRERAHTPESGQVPARVRVAGDATFQMSIRKPGAGQQAVTLDASKSKAFEDAIEHWSHQFALLSVLVLAPVVSLLFRRRYFFDHLVFSLHSLSFQGAIFTGLMLLGAVKFPQPQILLLAIPTHVFFHLKGAYGLSGWGATWRTFLMLMGEACGFILIMIALVLVGLAATR
jgi:hypothetical protein